MIKFFIDQHGCAKNQVDAELLINHLVNEGFEQTFLAEEAEIIIVNSCGFIESAKKESIDAVCVAKTQYPSAKVLLTGCLAERYPQILKDSLPEADGIFGNGDLTHIGEVVSSLIAGNRPVITYPQKGVCCGERNVFLSFRSSAFVKITEGCSNHCSFCAIPIIRGELRSRPAAEIIDEIKKLIELGFVEINLIGQDLAAYGTGHEDNVFGDGVYPLPKIDKDGINLGTEKKSALSLLLKQISMLSGNFRIRLLYIHPDHFNCDILPIMQTDSRLLPYFDIPFQSGDTEVIRAMNRKGSDKGYIKLVENIRRVLPNAVLRTTFLTGFPGESEKSAQNTIAFLKSIKSDWSGCFPYSREEDTPAYSMKKRIASKISVQRAEQLSIVQSEITKNSLLSRVGAEYEVLVEEVVIGDEGIAIGRAWFQAPDVDSSVVVRYDKDDEFANNCVKAGHIVNVKIVSSSGVDLDGIFIGIPETPFAENSSLLTFACEVQNL